MRRERCLQASVLCVHYVTPETFEAWRYEAYLEIEIQMEILDFRENLNRQF